MAEKIIHEHTLFRPTRLLTQMTVGAQPHIWAMRSIELFRTKVAPTVRKRTAAPRKTLNALVAVDGVSCVAHSLRGLVVQAPLRCGPSHSQDYNLMNYGDFRFCPFTLLNVLL